MKILDIVKIVGGGISIIMLPTLVIIFFNALRLGNLGTFTDFFHGYRLFMIAIFLILIISFRIIKNHVNKHEVETRFTKTIMWLLFMLGTFYILSILSYVGYTNWTQLGFSLDDLVENVIEIGIVAIIILISAYIFRYVIDK
jgi:hypothetical protein